MRHYYYDPVQPVAETLKGKVLGYTYGGVEHYFGIPYAKAERFSEPVETDAWEGVKPALIYADFPMQMSRPGKGFSLYGIQRFWPESEDCLYLNVWAPKRDGKKRPVFVWMHGGGFANGAATEAYTYDLFNMCHFGDVVCVSLNARLGVLGFLNLEEYGEAFRHSGNLGIMDLSRALKWVHENIKAFGGDPENVTICGQSGGGGKVRAMMGIEENKGRFQKAIIMSGCMGADRKDQTGSTEKARAISRRMAREMVEYLGLSKDSIDEIRTIPYEKLIEAYRVVDERFTEEGIRLFVGPTGDDYYRGNELEMGYCDWAADVSKLYGTVIAEFAAFSGLVPMGMKEFWSEEKQNDYLRERFGDALPGILQAFRTAYPDHPLIDCAYVDTNTRLSTMNTALMASENGKDNTWIFVLAYDFPMEGGAPAFHCGDIPFAFHNIQAVPVANEEVVGERLQMQMFGSFMAFVKTGDPNHEGIPYWKPVSEADQATMYFDVKSGCRENADKELLACITAATPLSMPHIRMAKDE